MTETLTITPVRKSVHVACSVELAFEVFTRDTASWWPTSTHARHPGTVDAVVWEEREGGAVYEMTASGERGHWATVLAWDPPNRLVLSWEVSENRPATEVEVCFSADGDGTRVDLEHRGWDRLGDEATATRASYDSGWDVVLAPFVGQAGARET
jgi:uncharacterized protein YndB with AHSA1/START domain